MRHRAATSSSTIEAMHLRAVRVSKSGDPIPSDSSSSRAFYGSRANQSRYAVAENRRAIFPRSAPFIRIDRCVFRYVKQDCDIENVFFFIYISEDRSRLENCDGQYLYVKRE